MFAVFSLHFLGLKYRSYDVGSFNTSPLLAKIFLECTYCMHAYVMLSNLHMVSIAICSRTSWGANDAGWARNDTTWTTAHLLYISLIFADFFDKITFAYLISIVCPKRIYQHWFVRKKLGPLQLELMYKCFGSFMWWVRKFQYSRVAT